MKADVVIVGAGQAGIPLATRLAAEAKKRVVLVERAQLGGTCVNDGCTPTKTMIASARAAHVARTAARLGVTTGSVSVDLGKVVDRKNAILERKRGGLAKHIADLGERLTLVRETARFTGPHTMAAGSTTIEAETIVLDVGMRPLIPKIPGLEGVPFLDHRKALDLRELPKKLVVLGGGYIGCELAQMFRRFGSEVAIIDHNAHLLSREDDDISSALEAVFRDEGIELALGAQVSRVEGTGTDLRVVLGSGETLAASHLLVATGRRPNTDGLGCEAAGVKLDAHGFIVADAHYATSAPGVYAVGDVIGGPAFTHTSWDDHRLLFDLLTGRRKSDRHARVVPHGVFTDPQVAGVGLDEREAKAKGIAYEVATMPFGAIARSYEIDEKAGTMKILVDPSSGRLLGVRLVGSEAAELIHVFSVVLESGGDLRPVVDGELIHPTFGEGLQSLVMSLARVRLQ
jgi:pyruvate/2-oxoglutarate dehydrogenase complex dihydrolipoamide dehydrogenase (E3) component